MLLIGPVGLLAVEVEIEMTLGLTEDPGAGPVGTEAAG